MEKKDLLKETVKHIDIKKYDSTELIDAMRHMSFTSRDTARAADILCQMLAEKDCTNILTIAGSTSAAGCMQVYVDMVRNKMIDAVVSTGASIIDMDLFEALGYKHYIGTKENVIPDTKLRELYIDRIYDTFIDEEELQACDQATCDVADLLEPRPYSSREFLYNVGKWLAEGHGVKKDSLIQTCYECGVPIFCPAFSDSSAGFGIGKHQWLRKQAGKPYVSIDSVADFLELTEIKMNCPESGLFMVGGGTPKNFAQDPCTSTPSRSPWPTSATAPAPPPHSSRPAAGARSARNSSRWSMPKAPPSSPPSSPTPTTTAPGATANTKTGSASSRNNPLPLSAGVQVNHPMHSCCFFPHNPYPATPLNHYEKITGRYGPSCMYVCPRRVHERRRSPGRRTD